jgi:regulator of cell morphogenesis and NO signaling
MDTQDTPIGQIVAEDYRTAQVFTDHGIDFCCGGATTLAAACAEKGIDPAALARQLAAVRQGPVERGQNYASWELPFLADYIRNVHHAYLQENTGQIAAYARKIAGVHGPQHPEVIEIAAIFDQMAVSMASHLREEESVLFPAVRRIHAARKAGVEPESGDQQALAESLAKLGREHEEIGAAMHAIHHLAKGYAIPDDVCNTFVVTYRKLQEFEDDLHKHVHLENNILFSRAARLQAPATPIFEPGTVGPDGTAAMFQLGSSETASRPGNP